MSARSYISQVNNCSTVCNVTCVVSTVNNNCNITTSNISRNYNLNYCIITSTVNDNLDCITDSKFSCSFSFIVIVTAHISYFSSVIACLQVFNCQLDSAVSNVSVIACTVNVNQHNTCCINRQNTDCNNLIKSFSNVDS